MSRSNRWVLGLIVLSLSLTITIIPTVRSQTPANNQIPVTLVAQEESSTKPPPASGMVCKVYALSDLGEDPNLCKWISETVPQVIEPGTWGQGESGKPVLTYYAQGKTLVVFHTPETQKKVEAFLGNLKKAMPMPKIASPVPAGKMQGNNQGVVPAQYHQPSVIKTGDSTPLPTDYPVPTQTKSPKHLFHFIIRYEGDGIIDSNVVEFMKTQMGQKWTNPPVTSYGPNETPVGPVYCAPTSCSPTPGGIALPNSPSWPTAPIAQPGAPMMLTPPMPPAPGTTSNNLTPPSSNPTSSESSTGQSQRPLRKSDSTPPITY